MKAQTILQKIRALGVTLKEDQGRLRLKAPPGILTDELKTEIAECKSAIISCLERESASPKPRKLKKECLRAAKDVLSQLGSAGVKPFGLHSIRHLTASILANAGEPLIRIQAILRHKKLATTERYLHRLTDLKSTMQVLSKRKSRLAEPSPSTKRHVQLEVVR